MPRLYGIHAANEIIKEGIVIRLEEAREYLRYYWTDFLWILPIIGIIICGAEGKEVSWLVYADLIAAFVVLVLLSNPFRFLSVLSFKLRICIVAVIALSLSAIQLPLDYISRGCLVVVAILIAGIAIVKRKQWVYMESVKQSPDVDNILAHLSYDGFFRAGDEWTKHGCAETRALLHQAAGIECPENLVNSAYYAVYCLAWLHGSCYYEELQEKVDALEEKMEQKEALEKEFKRQGTELKKLQAEYKTQGQQFANLFQEKRELDDLNISRIEQIRSLWKEKDELTQENERLTALLEQHGISVEEESPAVEGMEEAEPVPDEPEDLPLKDKVPAEYGDGWNDLTRDQKIIAYNDAGMGYAKIGELFGLTKPGVQSVIRRERAKLQENPA